MNSDISRLELRLVEKMGELKHELLKWMVGAMIAQVVLILAVTALFF